MCIAIVKKPKGKILDETIKRCARINADGGGYAFINTEGQMVVKKGYFDVEKFIHDYRIDEKLYSDKPMLLHFRIGTGGTKTPDNTHPFQFKHGALIHNGYLFQATTDRSDTREMIETFSDEFSEANVKKHIKELDQLFGFNKLAILFNSGRVAIINEDKGMWDEDVWYSNTGYKDTFFQGRGRFRHGSWAGGGD